MKLVFAADGFMYTYWMRLAGIKSYIRKFTTGHFLNTETYN